MTTALWLGAWFLLIAVILIAVLSQ